MGRPKPKRNAEVALAVAQAMLVEDEMAHKSPAAIRPFWLGGGHPPTAKQIRAAGCPRSSLEAIASGKLGHGAPPWTGGFLLGLRLAGALQRERPDRGVEVLSRRSPPELRSDLHYSGLPGRMRPRADGSLALVRCRWLGLPAEDAAGMDVVAGLLAAGGLTCGSDGSWVVLPHVEGVAGFLCDLGIHWLPMVGKSIKVSAFYGALLAGRMPVGSAWRMLGVARAGGCPALAVAMWEVVFGKAVPPLPPRSWALPWACGPATAAREGWTRRVAHQMAVGLGVASSCQGIRDACVDWAETAGVVVRA